MSTAARRFGDDTPFGAWVRAQQTLDSRRDGMTVNDVDWMFHKYMTPIDRIGAREIALLMCVEVKTRNSRPSHSQAETLWYNHRFLTARPNLRIGNRTVIHSGFFTLSMSGTSPDDSDEMEWGSFSPSGALEWVPITDAQLLDVLRFDVHPEPPFARRDFRRHHKTREVVSIVDTPIGLRVEERLLKRS